MRKNFGAKAILYPMPVLIIGTYDEDWNPNAMNAAWGGISEETQISICVDDGHKTAKNVVKTGAFTVSVADAENVVACDYVGIVSGNKEPDKIEKAGWYATKSEVVDAPLFDELPMALECKLISYDEETCRLVGEIVNVCADERILDGGTAFITDVGMTGPLNSVIGVKKEIIVDRYMNGGRHRFDPEDEGLSQFSALLLDIDDKTYKVTKLERIHIVE